MTDPHGAWFPNDPLADRRRAWLCTAFPPFRPQLPADGNPPAVRVSPPQREAAHVGGDPVAHHRPLLSLEHPAAADRGSELLPRHAGAVSSLARNIIYKALLVVIN